MSAPAIGITHSSDRKILVTFLLCFFLGFLGVHRYYVGKFGTGVLQLVTFGGLGLWVLVDLILLALGRFTDKSGNALKEWT